MRHDIILRNLNKNPCAVIDGHETPLLHRFANLFLGAIRDEDAIDEDPLFHAAGGTGGGAGVKGIGAAALGGGKIPSRM